MNVYAFDVDETLEISAGPVSLKSLMNLRAEGHIVGICGNWGCLTMRVDGWQHLISFLSNDGGMPGVPDYKAKFLRTLKQHVRADDFVMVGNVLGVSGASDDQGAASRAGWRFIKETDFAAGAR